MRTATAGELVAKNENESSTEHFGHSEIHRCGDAIRDAMSEWLMRFVMQPILGCRPCGCGKIAPGISTGITADNADPLFGFT